jgi:imidazolonepropionase-like amidohydrolase
VAGTDAGVTNTGFNSLVDELLAYVSVGFSCAEALRTATSDASEYLHLGAMGQVREGFRADLLLVSENPLVDLTTLREPQLVMKSGRVVAGQLEAMANRV